MRILTVGSLYPPHHLGGYELVWQAAVHALREAGHDVVVLATTHREPRSEGVPDEPGVFRELRWYWHEHEFPRLGLRDLVALERHNRRLLRRHMAGVDVVSWWAMGGMSMSLVEQVRRSDVEAIGWVNDDWLSYGPVVDQWQQRFGRFARLDLARAARYVLCSQAQRLRALADVPGIADSAVLHQGVAPDFTPAPEQPWQGRLLYAGRIDERKGLHTLVAAVEGLPEMTLRVIGDGDERTAAALLAQAGERVSFEGTVPRAQLARAYAEADAVVFPVEWDEPWGLVPLEAMAVGRPVVATGKGGSAEYLERDRNTLLFEAGNVEALREALSRLAGDEALRGRLRAGGFETAARLTEARWTAAVVAEHEGLLRSTPRGGG